MVRIKGESNTATVRELVKTTILEQDPPLGLGGSQRQHLSSILSHEHY